MAEWFKAPVLKTGVPARVPWVRIPPLPPEAIEIASLIEISKSFAQSNFVCCKAIGVVLAIIVAIGAIVSISAEVNKLRSSIE